MRFSRSIWSGLLCLAVMVLAVGAAPQPAQGSLISTTPFFFPPFADTGTVVEVEAVVWERDLPPVTCTFWEADSGGLYFFNGLEQYDVGDRLMVSGNLCLICLVYNECGVYAGPILNAKIQPLDPPDRKN